MFARLKGNAALVISLLFFVAGVVHDGIDGTITSPTVIFGLGAVIVLAQSAIGRRARNKPSEKVPKSLPPGLSCSEHGLRYVCDSGKEQRVDWDDILQVSWSEPDWGYEGSEPYWTIKGKRTSFDVEGAWGTAEEDLFPLCLARGLPGFDAAVIDKARRAGYFSTKTLETLVCWRRSDG